MQALLANAKADKANPDAQALAANLTGRVWRLRDSGARAICFARLDDEDGDILYVGRQHIADAAQTPLVIDWRARAAEPFYRATSLNPMGCVRRRLFVLEGDELLEIYDTDMTDPAAGAGIPDPLLAEINRARTGSMREIVATIQREQDLIVRAPLDRTLVVQGGPGTGKTAVGLHRAAYLLFEHRDLLSRDGVLVVGPNRRFLDYISDVLPSLGERTFRQVVPSDLADVELGDSDHLPVEFRVAAGHLGMGRLLRAYLESIPVAPSDGVRVRTPMGGATIDPVTAADHMSELIALGGPIGPARELWVSRLIGDLRTELRQRNVGGLTLPASEFSAAVRKEEAFRKWVQEHWRTSKPEQTVRAMWRHLRQNPAMLAACGFDDATIAGLGQRPDREKLTEVDRPLIDDASAQLGGRFFQYGHVILDEAQDLSPMALRMVSRRAKNGSFTVLGDVAQCSGDWMYQDWDLPLQALASGAAPVELVELTVGYRVPGEFIALANSLLASIAPGLSPTSSVRSAIDPAAYRVVAQRNLISDAVTAATRLGARWSSVAVIVADDETARQMRELVSDTVEVLQPREAKGLEFDAVLVVEAGAMNGGPTAGWRPLFVALTRAVQHLEIIGSEPLPASVKALLDEVA